MAKSAHKSFSRNGGKSKGGKFSTVTKPPCKGGKTSSGNIEKRSK